LRFVNVPERELRAGHQRGFAKLLIQLLRHVIHRAPAFFMRPPPKCRVCVEFFKIEHRNPTANWKKDLQIYEAGRKSQTAPTPFVGIKPYGKSQPKSFVAAYADGLERIGYRPSPLEMMAYMLESIFRNSQTPFDVAVIVREQLDALYFRT
jgi:hypothetical protein